jgi:hypothetical protein
MIEPSGHQKHYASARRRFLQVSIVQFLNQEFPQQFGPIMCRKVAQELVALVEKQMPAKDHLRPGQCVWNAVSRTTRPDSKKLRLVPVILTLVNEDDIELYVQGTSIQTIRDRALHRMLWEAFEQGGLLSMRDLGLLSLQSYSAIARWRVQLEKKDGRVRPHPGSLQDFGSTISHKAIIITKAYYEQKDPLQVAKEVKHTPKAVDRYLKDFHRVRECYGFNPDPEFIQKVTGMSRKLLKEYIDLIKHHEKGKIGA